LYFFVLHSVIFFIPRELSTRVKNNNKRICVASEGRNFRGAGARQRASEEREEKKVRKKRNVDFDCVHLRQHADISDNHSYGGDLAYSTKL